MAKNKNTVVELVETTTEIEAPYELPEGWKWCRLHDCSSIISKGTTPKGGKDAYVENGINFLRIENLNDDGSVNLENISHITLEEHTNYLKRSILEEGDLLISIAGTLGKVGFVEKKDLPINTNQAIAFVRLYKNLFNNMYLKYAIESPFINAELISKTKVTSIPNLTLDIISNCTIPLPPTLEEQQRIVNRIETLFAKLDQAKEKAQNVVDTFETRKASILYKAFTGELTKKWREENGVGDDSWEEKKLEDAYIINPKCIADDSVSASFIPMEKIEAHNVNKFSYNIDLWGKIKKNHTQFQDGDVCFAKISPCFENGKAFIAENLENGIGAGTTELIVLRNSKINTHYTFYLISDLSFIHGACSTYSGTVGQQRISMDYVRNYLVNIPTLPEQIEIVRILDSIFEKESKAKEAAEAVLKQIDLLKKSILARAFRGEL